MNEYRVNVNYTQRQCIPVYADTVEEAFNKIDMLLDQDAIAFPKDSFDKHIDSIQSPSGEYLLTR